MAPERVTATALEAIAGAVQLDGGETALKDVMKHLGLDQHRVLGT